MKSLCNYLQKRNLWRELFHKGELVFVCRNIFVKFGLKKILNVNQYSVLINSINKNIPYQTYFSKFGMSRSNNSHWKPNITRPDGKEGWNDVNLICVGC